MDCIFCKIASGEVAKEFTYETDDVMVFPDIHPNAPIHLLIIPKLHVKEFVAVDEDSLLLSLMKVVKEMVFKFGLEEKGYRIAINGGGAQQVHHLHIHLQGPISRSANQA
jgi:histidine triad (HIT) family protein